MRLHSKTHFIISLMLGLFAFNSELVAIECYSLSPNFKEHGDDYYNFDNAIKLTTTEKEKLAKLAGNLKGKWEGSGNLTTCKGPDSNIRKERKNIKSMTDVVTGSNGGFTLRSSVTFIESNVTKLNKLEISGNKNYFYSTFREKNNFSFSKEFRDQSGTDISGDLVFIFSEKNRTKTGTGSHFREYFYKVGLVDDSLIVEVSTYLNTVLISVERWKLERT